MGETWKPNSWHNYPTLQQPIYENKEHLQETLERVHHFPQLVLTDEIMFLRKQVAEAQEGRRFILQGGDCVERFSDCRSRVITNKLKILLQMSAIFSYNLRKPVSIIGRIAGQYAKPRSQLTEIVKGKKLPSYRGDNINDYEALEKSRKPDPTRLLRGYYNSSTILNYIRALISNGIINIRSSDMWELNQSLYSPHRNILDSMRSSIHQALNFADSYNMDLKTNGGFPPFFTSHEGLHLALEEAMTHYDRNYQKFFNTSCHMLWIGERTRQLEGGHLEYFKGIANPIGIKLGPTSEPAEVSELVKILNPRNEKGRIILITRLGKDHIDKKLPPLIEEIKKDHHKVCWLVDPMHGNTQSTPKGYKTRNFDSILLELQNTTQIHKDLGQDLHGVHFELTGDDVTECIGGIQGLEENDLSKNYNSYCDPRLNYTQSLEMAFSSIPNNSLPH